MFKYALIFVFFVGVSCNQLSPPTFENIPTSSNVQTVSLLGDSLRSGDASLPEELTSRIDSLISVANIEGNEATALIWKARLLGYNGEYRKAIELLTSGLETDNELEKAETLRHRGHRYLTLRAFDHGIKDFVSASELIKDTKDIIEQDGLPNALNKPTSTLHTNIWYHLGLAYYLKEDFENAQKAYQKCIMASTNDDMLVAAVYWYYMTLKRSGQDELAGKIIDPIHSEMEIIENDSYLKLLLVFKGEFESDLLLDEDLDALSNATLGYGIGNWHYINGRKERAKVIWKQVYDSGNWASFGFIASEAELAKPNE